MKMIVQLLIYILAMPLPTFATTDLVGKWKGDEIEINDNTAQLIYERMKQVVEKTTFDETWKTGANIRCSKLGIDPKIKNSSKKKYEYKCYFQVGEKGEATTPKPLTSAEL